MEFGPEETIHVRHSSTAEDGEDEESKIFLMDPEVKADRVEEQDEREPPAELIDNNLLSAIRPLIEDGADEQRLDDRPVQIVYQGCKPVQETVV
ncbi:hypothetical protein FRB94_012919 [Tulasnella sp. JGI-2019a]|nr:hypothetical protein FRB93_001598 [Tulasnella sp. JGI-2019a]KAG9008822.1 hypothetical protein FRB94_012919 [Tulasnella sp. JGI-2019a]